MFTQPPSSEGGKLCKERDRLNEFSKRGARSETPSRSVGILQLLSFLSLSFTLGRSFVPNANGKARFEDQSIRASFDRSGLHAEQTMDRSISGPSGPS